MLSISRRIGIQATKIFPKHRTIRPCTSRRIGIKGKYSLPELLSIHRPSIRFFSLDQNSPYFGDDHFEILLNVKSYRPNEIILKLIENEIVVHAKHEESDINNYFSKEILQKFIVPIGYNLEKITTSLTPDGILQIKAPSMKNYSSKERIIEVKYHE